MLPVDIAFCKAVQKNLTLFKTPTENPAKNENQSSNTENLAAKQNKTPSL